MTAQPLKTLVLNLLQQGHLDEEAWWQEINESERTAIGTPECWSARDHMAHQMFWHQNLIDRITAILWHQEVPASEESEDQINAKVFEEHRLRPWSELHAEAERVYAELVSLAAQLNEDDLTTTHRFAAITGEHPLYTAFVGSCYEHDQEHLAQYFLDRNALPRAIEIRERCADRILQAEVPAWVKGWFLYNLACFYAQQKQREKAAAHLQQALTLAPDLIEQSQNEPDLAVLRDHAA